MDGRKSQNGDLVSNITDITQWSNLTTGAYCNYNNEVNKVDTYGRLYNWYVVNDNRNIAPKGWYVPTDIDWTNLLNYLGGYTIARSKLKEIGTTYWQAPNTGSTSESGFTALPGGIRNFDGIFSNIGECSHWWSFSEYSNTHANIIYLAYNNN